MPIYFSRNYIKIFEILIFGVGVCTCYVRQCHIEEDRDMTDYGIGGPGDAIDVLTESSVQCGSLCLHEKVCISFFFNTATKACKGLTGNLTVSDAVVEDGGSRYYRLKSCPFRGFTYGQTTNVTRPLDANASVTMPFDQEISISGNGGIMKNDEFTCQREGLYKIHVYVMPKNSVDVTNLVLYKSGEQVVRVSISDRNVVGTTTVLELHIGDTVYGQLVSGHNFDSSAYGHMRDMVTILTAIYIADLNEGRPCFTAGLTSDTALSTHSQLVYNKLVTDIGGMYSTATGKVTIGTSGIYIFHIHAHAQANDAVDLQVVHNETHVVCVFYAVISGMADPRSAAAGNTFLMHMAQGDTVTVRNKETGVASGLTGLLTPTNTMTGVLVASNADLNNGKAMSAFSVALESTLVVPPGDRVIFDHVIFDLNGDFNMSTGEFVAPIAGLYEFNFHATGWWNEKLWLELYCNDRYIVSTYGERIGDSPYPVVGNAAVCELKNKDRCYIKSVQFENKFWGGPEDISTTFSGHLVAPDAR